MNRYLTIYIPKTAVPAPVSAFFARRQVLQKADQPGEVPSRWYPKNGQQCRVTETAYPGIRS